MANFDPVYWWHQILENPVTAGKQAVIAAMIEKDCFDVTRFWRQFYDDSVYPSLLWYSLLIYIGGCAIMFYRVRSRERDSEGVREFWKFLLPRAVFAARSFRVDVQFYILRLLKIPSVINQIAALLVFANYVPKLIVALDLKRHLHLGGVSQALATGPAWLGDSIALAVAFLGFSFGSYWAHRWAHEWKFLWQFHKVHHYSRQLNVLTYARTHPIDDMFQQQLSIFAMVFALSLLFPYGGARSPIDLAEGHWQLLIVFNVAAGFLDRFCHSHVPISFGRILDRVITSPAVHIAHHSREVPDRNFGGVVSFYDVLFGTYYVQDYKKQVLLGIHEFDDNHYRSIVDAVIEPFFDAARVLRTFFGRGPKPALDANSGGAAGQGLDQFRWL